jgi:hypothetical protein
LAARTIVDDDLLPQWRDNRSARMRAAMSTEPPGACDRISRTGFVGQSCAAAGHGAAVAATQSHKSNRRMVLPLSRFR